MNIIRVFPIRTAATPEDPMVFIGPPPLMTPKAKEVHISCTFTWHRKESEYIARAWAQRGYTVRLGGPAYDATAGDFVPGMYVKTGMTITSRGCIRKCPFCYVPKREGSLRLLEIKPGWDILDNNLLACPRNHIDAVLNMLEGQKHPSRFTGGIDSRLCQSWFASRLGKMRLQILYTAYDTPSEHTHVERAIKMLRDAGLTQRQVGCYVLVGYEGDTIEHAKERLEWVFGIGGTPFAMLFRDKTGKRRSKQWGRFARLWIRPAAIFAIHKNTAGSSL